MRAAFALRIISGRIIYIYPPGRSADLPGGLFHERELYLAAAVSHYDPSRENVIPERPQTLRYYESINDFPLKMARAQRKPF